MAPQAIAWVRTPWAFRSSRKVPVSPTGRGRFRDDKTPWVLMWARGSVVERRSAASNSTQPRQNG